MGFGVANRVVERVPARGSDSTHESPHTSHPLATTAPQAPTANTPHRAPTDASASVMRSDCECRILACVESTPNCPAQWGRNHSPSATRVPCSIARLASSSAATSAPPMIV